MSPSSLDYFETLTRFCDEQTPHRRISPKNYPASPSWTWTLVERIQMPRRSQNFPAAQSLPIYRWIWVMDYHKAKLWESGLNSHSMFQSRIRDDFSIHPTECWCSRNNLYRSQCSHSNTTGNRSAIWSVFKLKINLTVWSVKLTNLTSFGILHFAELLSYLKNILFTHKSPWFNTFTLPRSG